MFDILKSLTKSVIGTAVLPLDVAADIATLGGALTDKEKPYTAKRLENIINNLEDATK